MDAESSVSKSVRLKAAQLGWKLWRNNVGVLRNERNVPVRFGLANESAQMNKLIKSSDLIGLVPVVITPDMVGTTVGVFTSVETKPEGWVWRGTEREVAQARYHNLVIENGGVAFFVSSEEAFDAMVSLMYPYNKTNPHTGDAT